MTKMPILLIFPNQLFKDHPLLTEERTVYLIEHPHFFTAYRYHQSQLVLHRASMQAYLKHIESKCRKVHYVEYHKYDGEGKWLKNQGVETIEMLDPVEEQLKKSLEKEAKNANFSLKIYDTPLFLLSPEELEEAFPKSAKHYSMASFYSSQRKKFDILLTKEGKPRGGKWSFDPENRKPLPNHVNVPEIRKLRETAILKEAKNYVEKYFPDNPGTTEQYCYPYDFSKAEQSLEDFLENRLKNFGQYQDAIRSDQTYLFHSVISPSLNIGLLTPDQVIEATLDFSQDKNIELSSLEGFIRQILGWREFMRAMYALRGKQDRSLNFFQHKAKMPDCFWQGTTGIDPVDQTIQRAKKFGYCHHIERLMVLGNFMMLCRFDPKDVHQWFMEHFVDAYDWVMVPNVFGMSQFSNGGSYTTKPYISSSNYILKMSNYPKGEWCKIWDGLYWAFIAKHESFFVKNPRLNMMVKIWKKMTDKTQKQHIDSADAFLKGLT